MNKEKIIYWGSTGLLSAQMLMAASFYVLKYDMVSEVFGTLGFPLFIIYPLALAKVSGVVAILTNKSAVLKEWAYAGFFFNFLLAFSAHLVACDGDFAPPIIATVLLFVSYITSKGVRTA
ncbi:DoxX family protein [bacterium]|jgi:hypothetical protein|nr:DoxX family protein [bacterium]